ncbi:hypothetical protein PoB_005301800 [Plakobranchus ocellatus]|uniref:Uncharacterized protein n=1 Tax=Plakobranchus ocellatus TaxID=259542 RepID=A0AAV4C3M7_9GAST|nr:hypothetical protein PoB_005301800 [Plakobranchus ocellatus]
MKRQAARYTDNHSDKHSEIQRTDKRLTGDRRHQSMIHNKVPQALRPSVRPGRQGQGTNPRQKDPCRSQGGFAIHCATDARLHSA